MKPLTLAEAAQFLRMSRSSLYQRKDIPRYRRSGSGTKGSVTLFDQDELEAWLQQRRVCDHDEPPPHAPATQGLQQESDTRQDVVDIPGQRVYHRNPTYRVAGEDRRASSD